MQIGVAGLVFALVQILFLQNAKYLVFALVKNRYLLALVGLLKELVGLRSRWRIPQSLVICYLLVSTVGSVAARMSSQDEVSAAAESKSF